MTLPRMLPSLLLTLVGATAVHADSSPRPEKVFQALESGKSQTVVVYGTSVSIGGQWAKEVQVYFDRLYPNQVTFINSARSGMHSNWGVENLQERVLEHQPDLVFIEFAINDAATKHGISTDDCRRNLDTMVKELRQQNPDVEIILQTMNPAWDSPAVPKSFASDRPHLSDYYAVYRAYAEQNELPFVDNFAVWSKVLEKDPAGFKKMVPDGIHPDSDSSSKVAWPTVKALLDEARIFAGSAWTLSIWPDGKMPGDATQEAEAIRTPERTDAIRITNVSHPTLSYYPVANANGATPVMIVCPGGGYSYVVADKEGTEVARWLNSLGISALVLKYRNPSNRDGALQDTQRAVRMTRVHAQEWNINPKQIGVIGFSAGGHLCAKASNVFEQQTYAPVDSVDEESCRPDFAVLVYPAYLDRDGKVAPDLNLSADIPPTLVVHNEDDARYVVGSKVYAAALTGKSPAHKFLLYQTGGHGYGLRCEEEAKAWPQDVEQWLKKIGVVAELH
ncbi:MAG: alpha/beta hydrolase fold domain-containing protein [Planctomycetaceae bacterium]|nr:alpha/beta hydrolase fold domain-containing protein [Planctomycetaceae bacterium]